MRKIILASTSPRRKKLLQQLGLDFEIVPSEVEEKLNPRLKPRHQAEELALQKAQAVAPKFDDAIIVAADTIVYLNDDVIGKPKDARDAKRILKKLRNKQHVVVTGFVLIDTAAKRTIVKSVETKVWFSKLSPQQISSYVEREKPFDKSGSYAINQLAATFVEKIEGDFFNVVGLPLFTFAKELGKLGIHIL